MEKVKFRAMKDGDAEDYAFLLKHEVEFAAKTGERLLGALVSLDESMSGYQITRLGHSLQSATRAWKDGADEDWITCALLHDIGDIYAPYNHDEYAATILRPFVREQCAWTVEVHGEFQKLYYYDKMGKDPNARDKFRGHPYFDDCAAFCERWDQSSFDPDYETYPIDFFRPIVLEVFSRKAYDPKVTRKGERVPLTDGKAAAERARKAAAQGFRQAI
jgi:predicted HD phosphohydrolase